MALEPEPYPGKLGASEWFARLVWWFLSRFTVTGIMESRCPQLPLRTPETVTGPEPDFDPLAFWLFPDWSDPDPKRAFWMLPPVEPCGYKIERQGDRFHYSMSGKTAHLPIRPPIACPKCFTYAVLSEPDNWFQCDNRSTCGHRWNWVAVQAQRQAKMEQHNALLPEQLRRPPRGIK